MRVTSYREDEAGGGKVCLPEIGCRPTTCNDSEGDFVLIVLGVERVIIIIITIPLKAKRRTVIQKTIIARIGDPKSKVDFNKDRWTLAGSKIRHVVGAVDDTTAY